MLLIVVVNAFANCEREFESSYNEKGWHFCRPGLRGNRKYR